MRHFPRTDENQQRIVSELRQLGMTVRVIAHLGRGLPDLLVGFRGQNYLFEVKNPAKPPSARALTDDEKIFHLTWCGQVAVVESTEQIVRAMSQVEHS